MAELPRHLGAALAPTGLAPPASGHSDMALNPDHGLVVESPRKLAAVLVPLVFRTDGWRVILTRRSDAMPTHAGQISFPGGGVAEGDADLAATALREFGEETGIAPAQVQLLGRFESWGTVTGYEIHPFVGVVQGEVRPRPDPREVAEIFEVPFSFVTDLANFRRESRTYQGRERFFHAVPYKDYYIWGATAGMLHVLAQRVQAKTD